MAQWHDAGASGTAVSASSLTFSYTTTSGATYLVVRVANAQDSAVTITGVTYNGISMYQIGTQADDLGQNRVTIFGLRSPSIGTANVVVTASASTDVIWAYARSADTVDTTSDASAHGTFVSENENGGDLSVTAGSASGDLVVDIISAYNVACVPDGSQTTDETANPGGGSVRVGASWEAATGASTVMSWTGPTYWALGAVAIKNGGGGGGTPPSSRLSLLGVG